MKIIVCLFITLAITVSLTGCVAIGFTGVGLAGKGDIIPVSFDVPELTSLTIKIHAKLYMTDEESSKIEIKLYENWAKELDIEITEDGQAVVASNVNFHTGWNDTNIPEIYISTKHLQNLNIEGVVDFNEATHIVTDTFTLLLSGVFNGELSLDVDELMVNMSGVGSMVLSGDAEKATIYSSGVGDINAFELTAQEAEINVIGVGSVEITSEVKINANLSGVGSILYKGNAEVNQNRTGVGSIKKSD
jgi:hypothetical protein